MIKANKFIVIFLLTFFYSSCQTKKMTFKTLEKDLKEFLISNGDVHELELEDFKEGKRGISITGTQNNYQRGDVKDGIYSFSQTRTHSKAYFLIVEDDKYSILNISTREGLDKAIEETLDFCERSNYCSEITNDYVTRLIRVYYKINKNPNNRSDINCQNGIKDTKDLP